MFHSYCLGSPESSDLAGDKPHTARTNTKYRSYSELVQLARADTAPPKLLKMDIEGFEYSVLLDLLRSSLPSTWPEQISMEVH
jgi:FkbM family methyltransferase